MLVGPAGGGGPVAPYHPPTTNQTPSTLTCGRATPIGAPATGATNGTSGAPPVLSPPPPPPLTVNNPADNALKRLLATSETQLNTAKTRLKDDQTAEQTTNNELNTLYADMADHGASVAKLGAARLLRQQLGQEQQQAGVDQQHINADKAKVDACKMPLYSDQAQADQQTANASSTALGSAYSGLTSTGVTVAKGQTLTQGQINSLTPKQLAAYNGYVKALNRANVDQARVQADIAAANQAYSQLQLFASDPSKYGTIANDAIGAANQVLNPLGYQLPDVAPSPNAQQNYDQATQAAAYWNAAFAYANAAVADQDASDKVTALEQQMAAYSKKHGGQTNSTLVGELQQAQAALSQASRNLNQTSSYFTNIQNQLAQQKITALQTEMAVSIAEQNLQAAETNLAGLEKLPGNIRRMELGDALTWLSQAKTELYDAQHGKFEITQFTTQELDAAVAAVKAENQGQGLDPLIDALGGQLQVNQQLYLIQTGQLYLTPAEQALAKSDPVTLAFLESVGVTLNPNDPSLTPQEKQIAQSNPLLFAFMKLGNVGIADGGHNTLKITIDGQDISTSKDPLLQKIWSDPNVQKALATGDPDAVMASLLPYVNVNQNIENIMLGTQAVRLEYVKTQMQQLMGGKNPTDQQAQQAMQILNTNMNAAFTSAERAQIFQVAGLPYFNEQYFESHFAAILNNISLGTTDPGSSGTAEDKIGQWLQPLLQNAPPEVANIVLNAIKAKYSLYWNQYVNSGTPSPVGANFYEALSMAVQLVPSRAAEFATWLTAHSKNGMSILQRMEGHDFFSIDNAMMDGFGTLSQAIYGDFKGSTSYTAQTYDSAYTDDAQQAQTAQSYAAANSNFSSFNAKIDVTSYFDQFKGDPHVGTPQKITSGTELRDMIGYALGLTPTNTAAAQKANYSQDWYASGTTARNIINLVAGWIQKEGGTNPTVTAVPMIYAAPGGAGVQYGALFRVQSANGQTVFIDGSAAEQAVYANNDNPVSPNASVNVQWHYSSVTDYENNNQLSESGTIYLPQNLTIQTGKDGHVLWDSHQAHNGSWKDIATPIIGIGVVIAGIALAPFTGGVSLAVAGAIGAGWGIYMGKDELDTMSAHGESTDVATNAQARWAWFTIGTSAFSLLTLGVGGIAGAETGVLARLAAAGSESGAGALAVRTGAAAQWLLDTGAPVISAAKVVTPFASKMDMGLGAFYAASQAIDVVENWDKMSGWSRFENLSMLGLGIAQMGMGHWLENYAGRGTPASAGASDDEPQFSVSAVGPIIQQRFDAISQQNPDQSPLDNWLQARDEVITEIAQSGQEQAGKLKSLLKGPPDFRIGIQVRLRSNKAKAFAGELDPDLPVGLGSPTAASVGVAFSFRTDWGALGKAFLTSVKDWNFSELRDVAGRELIISVRPAEFRNVTLAQRGLSFASIQTAFQFKGLDLLNAAEAILFGNPTDPAFEVIPRSAKDVGAAPGGGKVVQMAYGLRVKAQDYTLKPGETDFLGVTADQNPAGFAKLDGELTYTKLFEELKAYPQPALLSKLIPGWADLVKLRYEQRPELTVDLTLPKGTIVSKQFLEQNQAMLARARLNIQFIVSDPDDVDDLISGRPDVTTITNMAKSNQIDTGKIVSYVPGIRSGLRLSAITGNSAEVALTDLTGRSFRVWNPKQTNLDINFNDFFPTPFGGTKFVNPDRFFSRAAYPIRNLVHEITQRIPGLPSWARYDVPETQWLPTDSNTYYSMLGRRGEFGNPSVRRTLSISTLNWPDKLPHPLEMLPIPVVTSAELRIQWKTDPALQAPALDQPNLTARYYGVSGARTRIDVPGWLNSMVDWAQERGGMVIVPTSDVGSSLPSARQSMESFLDGLAVGATTDRQQRIGQFRSNVLPLFDGQFLTPRTVDATDDFLRNMSTPDAAAGSSPSTQPVAGQTMFKHGIKWNQTKWDAVNSLIDIGLTAPNRDFNVAAENARAAIGAQLPSKPDLTGEQIDAVAQLIAQAELAGPSRSGRSLWGNVLLGGSAIAGAVAGVIAQTHKLTGNQPVIPISKPTVTPTLAFVPLPPSLMPSTPRLAPKPPNRADTYAIRNGDSLWAIAQNQVRSIDPRLTGQNLVDATAVELGAIELANQQLNDPASGLTFDIIRPEETIILPQVQPPAV